MDYEAIESAALQLPRAKRARLADWLISSLDEGGSARRKTQPVLDLVTEVMDTFSEPYGEDVIEDVCIAIEGNPEWLKRYERLLTLLSRDAINNAIGYYTKQRAGMKTLKQVKATRTGLIGSYRKLTR